MGTALSLWQLTSSPGGWLRTYRLWDPVARRQGLRPLSRAFGSGQQGRRGGDAGVTGRIGQAVTVSAQTCDKGRFQQFKDFTDTVSLHSQDDPEWCMFPLLLTARHSHLASDTARWSQSPGRELLCVALPTPAANLDVCVLSRKGMVL